MGEEIIQIDEEPTKTWQQVHRALLMRLGDQDSLKIVVKDPTGVQETHWVALIHWEVKGTKPNPLHALGINPYQPPIPPIVAEVIPDSAAIGSGL